MALLVRFTFMSILLLGMTQITGCGSEPVQQAEDNSQASDAIRRLDAEIADAQKRQINMISPTHFAEALSSSNKAKKALVNKKDTETILRIVAEARAHLNKAQEVAAVGQTIIQSVLAARYDALAAEAPKYFAKDFEAIDEELRDVSTDLEDGSTRAAQKNRDQLKAKYLDVELKAIKAQRLGPARETIKRAIEEGAKKYSPRTLVETEKKISDADLFITANRHKMPDVQKLSQDSTAAAERLLKITQNAKASLNKDPEQIALEMEAEQKRLAEFSVKSAAEKSALETSVRGRDEELSKKQEVLALLQKEKKLNERYESARAQFSKEEAEVYKSGDKLLIRLKSLTFPAGQAFITPNNYHLLSKIQKVIKNFGDATITIEGHTDSAGAKLTNERLSTERAKAVEAYFVANDFVPKDRITAIGYGDEKPLASNRTKYGRAQNRRIDLILVPMPEKPGK